MSVNDRVAGVAQAVLDEKFGQVINKWFLRSHITINNNQPALSLTDIIGKHYKRETIQIQI